MFFHSNNINIQHLQKRDFLSNLHPHINVYIHIVMPMGLKISGTLIILTKV